MAKTSPTARSLALCRSLGYLVDRVEYWNTFARQRKDLFGFIDLVAIHPMKVGVLGIQCTTGANLSARINKAREIQAFETWLKSGNRIQFHGWAKRGGKLKRKVWTVRIVEFGWNDKPVKCADIETQASGVVIGWNANDD